MRRLLLPAAAALVLAVGLVLLVAGGEEDVVVDQPGQQGTSTSPATAEELPSSTPETTTAPDAEPVPDPVSVDIAEATALYIEAAEAGRVDPTGLPTSEELTIEDVVRRGSRATVRLAGGVVLHLRLSERRWRVVRVDRSAVPAPSPPSDGP